MAKPVLILSMFLAATILLPISAWMAFDLKGTVWDDVARYSIFGGLFGGGFLMLKLLGRAFFGADDREADD